MLVTITIDDVSDELHEKLESRARARGQSLEEYLLGHLERIASESSNESLMQSVRTRGPLASGGTADSASG